LLLYRKDVPNICSLGVREIIHFSSRYGAVDIMSIRGWNSHKDKAFFVVNAEDTDLVHNRPIASAFSSSDTSKYCCNAAIEVQPPRSWIVNCCKC
ncbi:MAG: hypothetical protein AAFP00_14600, partial [Bacteroidota bacterium]